MSGESRMGKPEEDEIGLGRGGDLFSDSVELAPAVGMMNSQPSPLPSDSPHLAVISNNSASPASGSSSTTKGFGLKKWRRIRRDMSKDESSEPDTSKVLKRGLSIVEPSRNRNGNRLENDCEADSSMGSLALGHMQSVLNDMSGFGAMDPELELVVARTGFSLGTDSDNSDDRSSQSSSTPTAFKHKREGLGYAKERNRTRIPGGNVSRQAVLSRAQGWKDCGSDVDKKESELQIAHEEENSHSSVESDLRSSNTVAAQCHGTSANGSPSEASVNFDGENSGNTEVIEEAQPGMHKEDARADILGNEKRNVWEDYSHSEGEDHLAESIFFLQRAQEALDKEVEKLGGVGTQEAMPSSHSSCHSNHEEYKQGRIDSVGVKPSELRRGAEYLEGDLRKVGSAVEAKEGRGLKLKEMELEHDSLIRKNIEAEIEYLMLMSTVQEQVLIIKGDPVTLHEQKNAGSGEEQNKLEDDEGKATVLLTTQSEELDLTSRRLLGSKKALTLKNRVCKVSICCFIQFMLSFAALVSFFIQLLPPSYETVPT